METSSKQVVAAVDTKRYEVLTVHQWLARFNEEVKREHNPGRAHHTVKFDRCVQSVKKRLKGVSNPYAVCMAALGKKALKKRRR